MAYDAWAARDAARLRRELAALDSAYHATARPSVDDTREYAGARAELTARLARPPLPRAVYDSVFRAGRYRCRAVRYWSDGLRVAGFIFEAAGDHPAARVARRPVLVYNRGGEREFGALVPELMLGGFVRPALDRGYVVVASQYRGNGGGEGREEFGGADVRDVLHLAPLVAALPEADTENVFMLGVSRGGMETYLAIRQGMRLNAAAVVSGVTDLTANLTDQPGARPGFAREVYAPLIPGYAAGDSATRWAALRARSAVAWPEAIRTPVLLLHGTADWRVPAGDALRLAAGLQQAGRSYSLVVYDGDAHGLPLNRADAVARVLAWFDRHARTPGAPGGEGAP